MAGFVQAETTSVHGGVNLYGPATKIGDNYATKLTNFDARTPGQLVKRQEPTQIATCGGSGTVNGITGFVDSAGAKWIVMARGGKLYKWGGTASAPTEYTVTGPGGSGTAPLSTTNNVRFAQSITTLYAVDGAGYLTKFTGAAASAVPGAGVNLPITPGTLSIADQHSHTVTDDSAGNLTLTGDPTWSGTIDYTTGCYTFSSNPWTALDTVTASWDKATLQADETIGRSAQDGTLEYPSLLHAPIKHSSLTLTDAHSNAVTSNNTDAGGSYPTGWKQLMVGASQVGAYDPTTAKFMVDVATFTAGDVVTAAYTYGTQAVTGEDYALDETPVKWIETTEGYSFTTRAVTHHANGVVPQTTTVHTVNWGDFEWVDDHDTYEHLQNGSAWEAQVDFATGEVYGGSFIGTEVVSEYPTIDYSYWTTAETDEAVGTADGDGKLFQFTTSQSPLAEYKCRLKDASTTAEAVADGSASNNFTISGNTKGTVTWATGVCAITVASTFTAGTNITVQYYIESATSTTIQNGPLVGVIGASIPFGASDILWHNQRLWLASGANLYYSDALTPEVYSNLPKGVGLTIRRILAYSSNQVLSFCSGDEKGDAIYNTDASGATPSTWPTTIVCKTTPLSTVNTIFRAATNSNSDIFYATREGLRTLKTTQTDALSGPSLPLDIHVSTWLEEINASAGDVHFGEVYKDEVFRFYATGTDTRPKTVFCYSLTNAYLQAATTGGLPHDGWSRMELGTAVVAAIAWDFGSGTYLYAVGTDGKIYKMLSATTTALTATVESKAYVAANPMQDIIPQWVYVQTSDESTGAYTVTLIDDQDREYSLGSHTVAASAPTLNTHTFECYDTTGSLPSSKSWRVRITTTAYVIIETWQIACMPEKVRQTEQDDDESSPTETATSMAIAATTPADF